MDPARKRRVDVRGCEGPQSRGEGGQSGTEQSTRQGQSQRPQICCLVTSAPRTRCVWVLSWPAGIDALKLGLGSVLQSSFKPTRKRGSLASCFRIELWREFLVACGMREASFRIGLVAPTGLGVHTTRHSGGAKARAGDESVAGWRTAAVRAEHRHRPSDMINTESVPICWTKWH